MSAGMISRHTESRRSPLVDDVPPFAVRRFTVDEYHRLMDAGILKDGDPYELLDGWITRKMTHNPAHDVCVDLLSEFFSQQLPKGWRPRIQSSIRLSASEPEPDVAIVRGSARDFLGTHPTPDTIALVIEVADSSLDRDRLKIPLCAKDLVARYWLINLAERVVEDYTQPMSKGEKSRYKVVRRVEADERLALTVGRKMISLLVSDVLP